VHKCYKFGEDPSSTFQDFVTTVSGMYARTPLGCIGKTSAPYTKTIHQINTFSARDQISRPEYSQDISSRYSPFVDKYTRLYSSHLQFCIQLQLRKGQHTAFSWHITDRQDFQLLPHSYRTSLKFSSHFSRFLSH